MKEQLLKLNKPRKTIIRKIKKIRNSKTEFIRYGSKNLKRLKTGWRKPKGLDNKVRLSRKGYLPTPNIGYRSPKNIRNIHPSGFIDVLVSNLDELKKLDPNIHAVRISHTVGLRKKLEISRIAKDMKFKLVNPPKEKESEKETESEESEENVEGGSL